MHNPSDTSATALGALLCFVWGAFLLGWLVQKSRIVAETVLWFRKSSTPRRIAAVLVVAGLVAYGGSKGNGALQSPRTPLLQHLEEQPLEPNFAPVSVCTNGVVFRAETTNSVELAAFRRIGGTELGEWLDADAPFFSIGTNPVSRCYVAASGSVSFESMRRPPVGSLLPDGTGLPALCPLRAPLGMVPEANWGVADAQSRFWYDALPGGGRVLTWENALMDRLPGRRVSLQVELQPSGDSVFRYDFHDALDPPATNFVMGAQMGTNGVNALSILGTNVLAATVWNVDGHPLTNGVSVADLLCTNGVLRTPATFEIKWKNTTGLDPNADTDNDGLTDWAETFLWGTDPNHADTDGDGLADGAEASAGCDLLYPDTDGDGMADGWDVEPATVAATAAFGQSAAWLAVAGVNGYTNALEWAQGVVATNEDAHVLGLSVARATPAFPAAVSLPGFPVVVLDGDATLWLPVAIAEAYEFDFVSGAELAIEVVEPPPRPLLRSGNSGVQTVEGTDGWNLTSTVEGRRARYMRKPWQQLRNCTGELNSTWMSFEVETRPRKGGTYTWSSMPEDFLQRVNDNRALCFWPDDSQVGTAEIRVVWEKDAFAVTNFLVVGRPRQQEGETPLLSLDIDGGNEGIVFVRTNGLGQVVLRDQNPALLTCRVASTTAVGSVTLSCPLSGKVQVRTMVNGHDAEISLPYTWNPQTTGAKTVFQVRGVETSDAVRDIHFTATIPGTSASASVDMTVARVEHKTLSNYPSGCSARTALGIGEEIRLYIIPSGTYQGSHWSTTSGRLDAKQNKWYAYAEAPYHSGILDVSFTYINKMTTTIFDVYEPEKFVADISAVTTTSFLGPGRAGGLSVHFNPVYLFPTNVSFYRIATTEGACVASNIQGYFTYCDTNSLTHDIAQGAIRWIPTQFDNNVGDDTAALIGEIPKLPFVDGTYGWISGQFEFQIPLSFRILRQSNLHKTFSGPTQGNTFFAFSAQKYHLDATGTLSIEKFSIRTSCDTNRVVSATTIP